MKNPIFPRLLFVVALVLVIVSLSLHQLYVWVRTNDQSVISNTVASIPSRIDSSPSSSLREYDPEQYRDFASYLRNSLDESGSRERALPAQDNKLVETNDQPFYDHDRDYTKVSYEYVPQEIIQPQPLKQREPSIVQVSSQLKGFANVVGIEPGEVNVVTNQSFEVIFDQPPRQSLVEALRFYPEAEATKTVEGNTVTVTPYRLERNALYTFGASFNVLCSFDTSVPCENTEETTAEFPYSFSFSTDWKERYIYGNSVWGKPLEAFVMGFGDKNGKVMMLTGGIHGSEWRSGDLTRLKDYLWTRPEELRGQNKTMIIIPFMNPDGTELNYRYNARDVNLNRNYYSYWRPCSFCGYKPHSEPETYYWARFAQSEGTTHLISYHAQWPPVGIIFKGQDDNPNIDFFARWVSDRTGYPVGYYTGDPNFDTDIVPGDQTVWAADWGVESILIEATSIYSSDWDKNFPMYLALIRQY